MSRRSAGSPADVVPKLADEIAAAGSRFSSHLWRNTASGNLGGWQVARCLMLLHVLSGSVGTPGRCQSRTAGTSSFRSPVPEPPADSSAGTSLIWPREYPLSHYEMSFLCRTCSTSKKRKVDVYFTRVYNPVWTNPDGFSWIEMLARTRSIGCHVALTPIWSETRSGPTTCCRWGSAPSATT